MSDAGSPGPTPPKKAAAKRAGPKKSAPTTAAPKRGAGKKAAIKKAAAPKQTAQPAAPEPKRGRLSAAREKARSAPSSKFFDRARKRAHKILDDPAALQKVAQESYRSGAARSGPFADVMDDFRALVRLVVAYARGNYRNIPADSLAIVVAGLIYVVSPIDFIPDTIPGVGFLDDAMVIGWDMKSVRGELDAFRAWELGQPT